MNGSRDALRGWLDLLSISNGLKKAVDTEMRTLFGISISRFDVLAALERAGSEGLRAGALSQMLMVTEGNTTQVAAPLIRDGLVKKRADKGDARVAILSLTRKGEKLFAQMAEEHALCINDAFSALSKNDIATLRRLLNRITPPNTQTSSKKDAA